MTFRDLGKDYLLLLANLYDANYGYPNAASGHKRNCIFLMVLMHQIPEANLCKIQTCGSDSAYTKSMKNKGFMIKFSTRMK